MASGLTDFRVEFFQDVLRDADTDGEFAADAFFEIYTSTLEDAGELASSHRVFYSRRGVHVDGYGGDPIDSADGILHILISDFDDSLEDGIPTLTQTDLDAMFKRAAAFVEKAIEPAFRDSLEESSPAFGLADTIATRWTGVERVKFTVMSNRQLSRRIDSLAGGEVSGTPAIHNVWDIERLHQFAESGRGYEQVTIDLETDFGGAVPLLPAHVDGTGYEAYLAVIPGTQLAAIYDRWGARLLEQNVRVFLQARGKVNQGIRSTIINEPEMFFAFNNGLTATAESINTRRSDDGLLLTSIDGLQIVNGGQTTASLHAARRAGEPLARIFVQMKLSIVDPALAEEIVPRISEYANTQNKVNAADLSSNHPFHVRMQEFSRQTFAPPAEGEVRQSKWFYERSRGQYLDEKGKLDARDQREFVQHFPKSQCFTKTDLAKFATVWDCRPDRVSTGAQKNFVAFSAEIAEAWDKKSDAFNGDYYRRLIAMAIAFRSLETLIPRQDWYESGYRANIVAYAISKLAYDVREMGMAVDFDAIWDRQSLPPVVEASLLQSAKAVHGVLTDPPSTTRNISEWAKKVACWERIMPLTITWPAVFLETLIPEEEQRASARQAAKGQRVDDAIGIQVKVIEAGASTWLEIISWASSKQMLNKNEVGILRSCTLPNGKLPTERQCDAALKILGRLHKAGCPIARDLTA